MLFSHFVSVYVIKRCWLVWGVKRKDAPSSILLSCSHGDRWGARDLSTLSLHMILFSHSLWASQNFNPVHSEMLFSQRFFCRPFLPPCKIVLVSPADLDSCPYRHVIIGPDGLVMWSLYEMPSSFLEHLISVACNFFRMSDINVQLSQAYNCTEITRERIRLILEGCAYRSRWSSVSLVLLLSV